MDFAELLQRAGTDPARTKLLRHDHRGRAAWQMGRDRFGSFLSVQDRAHSPYRTDPAFAAHFVPGPTLPTGAASAIFVGLTRLLDRFPWSEDRLPRLWLPGDHDNGGAMPGGSEAIEGSDHEWLEALADHSGRLLIDWGFAPRSWHQWAAERTKPILGDLPGAGQAGSPLLLDAAQRQAATITLENDEIARALAGNPEAVTRAFALRRIEARPAQTSFRAGLIARYGAACAITGPCPAEVLEAAHIVPYAEGHAWRDRAANGLLLRRDIHRLFDLLRLAVDPADFTVWLAPDLRAPAGLQAPPYGGLHGQPIETLASPAALGTHFRRARHLAGAAG